MKSVENKDLVVAASNRKKYLILADEKGGFSCTM